MNESSSRIEITMQDLQSALLDKEITAIGLKKMIADLSQQLSAAQLENARLTAMMSERVEQSDA